jgi:release factor glutamine methyltransferase
LSTIQELLQKGRTLLQDFPQPAPDARILLQKASNLPEETVYARPERKLSRRQERQFYKLISRRRQGFPLAYLTGEKEFWSIPFRVSPGVFIPRPETELVVEKVLEFSSQGEETIVDIGTGCGNIALSLARELPQAQIMATDTSQKALKVARANAELQNVSQVQFVRGNLFSPLKKLDFKQKCDFIISNPPYVSESEWAELAQEIKNYEPKKAVVAGVTGLEFIQKLIHGAQPFLKPGGYLLVEIGKGQQESVITLFDSGWKNVESFDDLAHIPRLILAQKK